MDDVIVKPSELSTVELQTHLQLNGFITKPPVRLDSGSALGLKLTLNHYRVFNFARGNVIPEVPPHCSRRELFSVCGKLVGHYPVAGWLRVACSYIKRHAERYKWEDYIGDISYQMICETLAKVCAEDPVKEQWHAPKMGRVIV